MVWNDAQNQLECTMLGKEVGRTSKGLVGMRPITIIVTIGPIYRESHIMPEQIATRMHPADQDATEPTRRRLAIFCPANN